MEPRYPTPCQGLIAADGTGDASWSGGAIIAPTAQVEHGNASVPAHQCYAGRQHRRAFRKAECSAAQSLQAGAQVEVEALDTVGAEPLYAMEWCGHQGPIDITTIRSNGPSLGQDQRIDQRSKYTFVALADAERNDPLGATVQCTSQPDPIPLVAHIRAELIHLIAPALGDEAWPKCGSDALDPCDDRGGGDTQDTLRAANTTALACERHDAIIHTRYECPVTVLVALVLTAGSATHQLHGAPLAFRVAQALAIRARVGYGVKHVPTTAKPHSSCGDGLEHLGYTYCTEMRVDARTTITI